MPQFLALTSKGLHDVLAIELRDLGVEVLEKSPAGVYFETNWAGCYRVNLRSRIATRVALTILDFPAYNQEDLYHNIRKHDFTKYINPNSTIAVEATTQSEIFRDQRFVAQKVKDAIVDQFQDEFGERPSVDLERPTLNILVKIRDHEVNVSIDTTGEALFRRGLRRATVEAPLKETLAAGLLRMAEWKPEIPLIDPMCGSGTILLEAMLIAKGIAPGTLRPNFDFTRWKTFQREVFDKEVSDAMALEVEDETLAEGLYYGYDIDRQAVESTRKNLRHAGFDKWVSVERLSIELLEPKVDRPGILIANPPYGTRLGERDLLMDTYRDFGFSLKKRFKGWTAWVLSGEPELPRLLGMKASRKIPVWNGNIECRFLKYEIR